MVVRRSDDAGRGVDPDGDRLLLALKSTQQGKYLVWGLAATAAAGLVIVVEQVWVTDDERIEYVVQDLRNALLAGDADALLARMTPDVQYVQEGETLSGAATQNLIRTSVANSKFETVRVYGLQTSVGRQSRRGKAEFKVFVQGSVQGPHGMGGSARPTPHGRSASRRTSRASGR